MKVIVISYSLTGNNEALAKSIATEFGAEHIKLTESKTRTISTIFFDVLFNRTPEVNPKAVKVGDNDLVVFVGPVWMGQAATPLRDCFEQLKDKPNKYAFVSISGGADGNNPKLAADLKKRMGKEPAKLIDLHIADLLPSNPKPERKDTMAYHLTDTDIKNLTNKAVATLNELVLVTTV